MSTYSYLNSRAAASTYQQHAQQALIASVTDSKDNLFTSNMMPMPPKFNFQDRSGRVNWRMIMNTDVDKIVKDVDLKQLEGLLQNITYAQLDREDLERLGDAHFIKLFKLSQLSIEYLIYTQNYLETLTKTLDMQYKHSYEETIKVREAIKKQNSQLTVLKKELKLKQKTLQTYEYLLKLPSDADQSNFARCNHCPKFFVNKQFLKKHYQKTHPEKDFFSEHGAADAPVARQDDSNAADRPNLQRQIIQQNNEDLFAKIKQDLFDSLSTNLHKVESEIHDVKQKQSLMQTMDARNKEEQQKLQDSLQKPAYMLDELKEKWQSMMANQTDQMRDMVQQSVNDALSRRKEDRQQRKNLRDGMSSNEGDNNSKPSHPTQFYEKKLEQYEQVFSEKDRIIEEFKGKIQKMVEDQKAKEEKISELARKESLMENSIKELQQEKFSKEEEFMRKETQIAQQLELQKKEYDEKMLEKERLDKLKQQEYEEKLERERLDKLEHEKKLKQQEEDHKEKLRQQREKESADKKALEEKNALLAQQAAEVAKKAEEEKKKLLEEQQAQKEKELKEVEARAKKEREEDAARIATEAKAAAALAALKKEQEEKEAQEEEEARIIKETADKAAAAARAQEALEAKIAEEAEENERQRQLKIKKQKEEEAARRKAEEEKKQQEMVQIEEEQEEEEEESEEESSHPANQHHNLTAEEFQHVEEKLHDLVSAEKLKKVRNELESILTQARLKKKSNSYNSQNAVIKSFFTHDIEEVERRKNKLHQEMQQEVSATLQEDNKQYGFQYLNIKQTAYQQEMLVDLPKELAQISILDLGKYSETLTRQSFEANLKPYLDHLEVYVMQKMKDPQVIA